MTDRRLQRKVLPITALVKMSKVSRERILFIVPLPPPVHGSSMVSMQIQQSEKINAAFDCRYVNLSTSRGNDEVAGFSPLLLLKKGVRFIASFLQTFWQLLIFRPQKCYVAIACRGVGFLKDAPFVLLAKMFGCKVILHQHNKGMAGYVDKPIYRWLLPLVYRDATVILLSWLLYDDVSAVVMREQVRICPNGI